MFRLDDKIAAVTGAGSGIGAATARAFAEAGAVVYLLEKDEAAGRAKAGQINAAGGGGRAEFLHTDVSLKSSCESAVAAILAAHGRCDVLVNNAGIGHVGTALTTSGDDLDLLMAVNVKGMLYMTQA